jgi:hypothetical protein
VEFADALLVGDSVDEKVSNHVKKAKGKKVLRLADKEENPLPLLTDFYQNILAN